MPLFDFLKNKRILIVGATGRVGSILWPRIAAAEPADLVLTGSRDFAQLGNMVIPEANYLKINLPNDISAISTDFDYVVLIAGVAKPLDANANPLNAITLNVESVYRILSRFRSTSARIVVASSTSSSVLGSAYASTKIALENLVAGLSTQDNPSVTAVRLGNVLETSGVVNALLDSLDIGKRVSVHSSTEFFQPRPTIPYTFHLALLPDAMPGDIFTHLMHPVPIPFLAGLLACAKLDSLTADWNPPYERRTAETPFLLPEWWWPYTGFVRIDRESGDIPREGTSGENKLVFLRTNFTRRFNVQLQKRVKRIVGNQRNAEFGRFIRWLQLEGLLPRGGVGRRS